jgi:AraC-like DNA-binding protein
LGVTIFDRDGTTVMVNEAMLTLSGALPHISSAAIVGHYNIFEDPEVVASGRLPLWRRAFAGHTVRLRHVSQPVDAIRGRYHLPASDVQALDQDIVAFPVGEAGGQAAYVAAVLLPPRVHRGNRGVAQAVAYLEAHYREPFDAEAVARVSGFSASHLVRLFRRQMGVSPHEYWATYRLERVKEALADPDVTVAEAFAAAGIPYSGRAAGRFKARTGLTPTQYRHGTLGA